METFESMYLSPAFYLVVLVVSATCVLLSLLVARTIWRRTKNNLIANHRMAMKELRKAYEEKLKSARAGQQKVLNPEMQKMSATALRLLYKPLKYMVQREGNPHAMFIQRNYPKGSQFVLLKSKASLFLKEFDEYMWGEYGQLFLPARIKGNLFQMRDMVNSLLNNNTQIKEELTISRWQTVEEIKRLLHGDKNVHRDLRKMINGSGSRNS